MQRRLYCKACGDPIPLKPPELSSDAVPDDIQAQQYCDECLGELVNGTIGPPPATMHGTGGGERVIRGTVSLGG